MKNLCHALTWSAILCLTILIGCEDQSSPGDSSEAIKSLDASATQPNLSGLSRSNGRVDPSDVHYQVFAFAGDRLYRIFSDRTFQEMGTSWSGTEAATVLGTNLFAVRAGTLWRASLSSALVQNFGGGWSGTVAMTNDGVGVVWAIRGGKIWRINGNNGDFYQLGNQTWTGATGLALCRYHDGVANFFYGLIVQTPFGETVIDPATGAVQPNYPSATLQTMLIPSWNPDPLESQWEFGVSGNQIVKFRPMEYGQQQPAFYQVSANANISGATDIAWTSYEQLCAGCNWIHNFWVLTNGIVYHYQGHAGPTTENDALKGSVKLPYSIYEVTSNQTH
jgi:hypothetical protein